MLKMRGIDWKILNGWILICVAKIKYCQNGEFENLI